MVLAPQPPHLIRTIARGLFGRLFKQTPPSKHAPLPVARSALISLIASFCSPGEMLRYLREHPDGLEIIAQIPQTASPIDVYEEVVDAFIRRGAVQDLLQLLVRHRSRRSEEVRVVARLWDLEVRLP